MAELQFTPGQVAEMPFHDGDGYSWGGDIIVTFGSRAINFGTSQNYNERQKLLALARMAASAVELAEALAPFAEVKVAEALTDCSDVARGFAARDFRRARAAIARATGAQS